MAERLSAEKCSGCGAGARNAPCDIVHLLVGGGKSGRRHDGGSKAKQIIAIAPRSPREASLRSLTAAGAFGAALFLIFAPRGYFGRRLRRPLGVVITLAAAAPVATLAGAALVFTGVPLGTRLPLMDWPVFAAGLVLGLGGLCILAMGYRRLSESAARSAPETWAEFEPAAPAASADTDEEEIRVRRV